MMKKSISKYTVNVLAASHIGKVHKDGQPNEDAFFYKVLDCGTFIGAIADGAGSMSAPFASVGSREAVRKIVASLEAYRGVWPKPENSDAEKEWEQILQSCFMETQRHLKTFVSSIQSFTGHLQNIQYSATQNSKVDSNAPLSTSKYLELSDAFLENEFVEMLKQKDSTPESMFASTLLVVVATTEWIAYGQIGDGGIMVQKLSVDNRTEGEITLERLTFDMHEIANHTVFLTSKNSIQQLQAGFCKDTITGIAIFSDGLERMVIDKKKNEPRISFLKPLFQIALESDNPACDSKELAKYLASDNIQTKTFDDTTIIVVGIGIK